MKKKLDISKAQMGVAVIDDNFVSHFGVFNVMFVIELVHFLGEAISIEYSKMKEQENTPFKTSCTCGYLYWLWIM